MPATVDELAQIYVDEGGAMQGPPFGRRTPPR
jgi:hypothetical protein